MLMRITVLVESLAVERLHEEELDGN